MVDIIDPPRVLRRESRSGRHGVAAMGSDDLLVGLEASVGKAVSVITGQTTTRGKEGIKGGDNKRSARAIRASDDQHSSRTHTSRLSGKPDLVRYLPR